MQQEESAILAGRLDGSGGPIVNAPLCVFSQVVTQDSREFLGVAMTGSNGRYEFAIGAGPSRDLTVAYRPDQRELTADAALETKVHPTFRLRNKVVENKRRPAIFTGRIPGPDNQNVVVVLQVKSGQGWRAFRRYRTRKGGRFVMRYLFTQTETPTTFLMRAQVGQRGYPYEKGNSRSIPVPVVP